MAHDLAWLPTASVSEQACQRSLRQRVCVGSAPQAGLECRNSFPHRLFRWRSRGDGQVLALMLPGIGTDADPVAMQQEQRCFEQATGVDQALWLPGVGDHGGGPTQEMLDQLQLWDCHPSRCHDVGHGAWLSAGVGALDGVDADLADELYLELHRGCPTSRPDQKRHNRTLERLLREADLVEALGAEAMPGRDWPTLLFQQFHDILPGTSIPEVFDQAESQWRRARRQAATARTEGLRCLLDGKASDAVPAPDGVERWAWCGLQPLQRWSPLRRLPSGDWRCQGRDLPVQQAAGGGVWVQLPEAAGIVALPLERRIDAIAAVLLPKRSVIPSGCRPLPSSTGVSVTAVLRLRWMSAV